jgi:hypothetical protein
MMLGDVSEDIPLLMVPSTPAVNPLDWLIGMYSMHIINSLDKYCWDVIKKYIGRWNDITKTMDQRENALDQIIATVKAKKQGKNLHRGIMNGRDWRELIAQLLLNIIDDEGAPMMSHTAVMLTKALQYISWLGNTSDDVDDIHIALMDCVCQILDVTLDALDPKHKARHEAKDHFHVAIHHLAQRMTTTRIPFLITEEGCFEAHLKVFDKAGLANCQFGDIKKDLKRIVGLAAIEVEGAIKFWVHKSNPPDKLKPPSIDSFVFLPCCLTTQKQKRTMINRCRSTIAYFPQEQFWSWASSDSGEGLFVRMRSGVDTKVFTPICLCPGSVDTPFLQCQWLDSQPLDDVLDTLEFQDMRIFIDNINQCGESKNNEGLAQRQREVAKGRRAAKQQRLLAQLQVEADARIQRRTVEQAKKKIVARPIRTEFARLQRVSKEFTNEHGSTTSDDIIRQKATDLEKQWVELSLSAERANVYGTISGLDHIILTANQQCDNFSHFVSDSSVVIDTPVLSCVEFDTDTSITSVVDHRPVLSAPTRSVVTEESLSARFDDTPDLSFSEAQKYIRDVVNNPSMTPLRRTPTRKKRNWADIGNKSFTFSESEALVFNTPSRSKRKSRRLPVVRVKSRGELMRDQAAERADIAGKVSRAQRAHTRLPPSRQTARKHRPKVLLPNRNRLATRRTTRASTRKRKNTHAKLMAAMHKELSNIPEPDADDIMHQITSKKSFAELDNGSLEYSEAVNGYYVTTRAVIHRKYEKLGCKYD